MNSPSAAVAIVPKTNSLALAFQDVLTVILRTRFSVQRWDSAEGMRARIRQMIASAAQSVRSNGYSDVTTQMALYAIVGFLDESVLSSRDPMFLDWSGRPLQEELFGDQLAGERFFRNVAELLNRSESSEVAEILELHCLCLMLGFRGKYAYGDATEIDGIVRRIREKIIRIRGPFAIVQELEVPAAPKAPSRDKWIRSLSIAAIALAFICFAAYIGLRFMLSQSVSSLDQAIDIRAQQLLTESMRRIVEMSL